MARTSVRHRVNLAVEVFVKPNEIAPMRVGREQFRGAIVPIVESPPGHVERHFWERFGAAILRYLAVAHYGRGRGDWVEGEYPAHWRPLVAELQG